MSICGKPFVEYIKIVLKAALISFLLIFPFFGLKANTESVRILTYHTFMGDKNIYSFSLEEFKKQCEELKSEGFTFITFTDFKTGKFKGDKNILLTVDDGHKTVYDAYKQVMRPLGIKPLLAVYPGITGKKKFALTWEQLKEMLDDGCTLASHGYYHNFCDEKTIKKNLKAVETEIIKSKAMLEEKLGVKVDTFVYPFGMYSPQTEEILKSAGYSYAMNIKKGAAKIGANPDYELPRYLMTRNRITNISGLFVQHSKTGIAEAKKSSQKIAADVKTNKFDGKAATKTEKKAAKKTDKRADKKDTSEPSVFSAYAENNYVENNYAENNQELPLLESDYSEDSRSSSSAVFEKYTKNLADLSEGAGVRPIKEKFYSLITILYDINTRFLNEMYTKMAEINLRIHDLFSGWKVFES